jgi:transcriptional regulator with XRE-family HTH domain
MERGANRRGDFGALIHFYRLSRGLSRRDMADLAGSRTSLGIWEANQGFPLAPAFKALMVTMGIPRDEWGAFVEPFDDSVERGSFAHVLRVCRYAAGMTSRALADSIGVAPLTVTRWESGWSVPNSEHLPALADALGVDVDEFIHLCPLDTGRSPRRHTHRVRLQWAADAVEEAAAGHGALSRLERRWGVSRGVVRYRLRVLRAGGYIGHLRAISRP